MPTGFEAGVARYSVFVTPRLGGAGTLGKFPDWLAWPQVAAGLSCTLHVGGQAVAAKRVAPSPDLPAPAQSLQAWKTLFPPSTVVESGVAERFDHLPILSYPVSNLAKSLQGIYSVAGIYGLGTVSRIQGAQVAQALGLSSDRAVLGRAKARFDNPLRAPLAGIRQPDVASDMALLRLFLGNFQQLPATHPKASRPAHPELLLSGDAPDFHAKISLLGEYPALLRAFGLVLDFEAPLSATPPEGTSAWVELSGKFALPPQTLSPRTMLAAGFRAKPRDVLTQEGSPAAPDLTPSGFLRVSQAWFDVLSLDAESGVFKIEAFLRNCVQATTHVAPDTPPVATTPSLRGAGMAVCRVNRGAVMAQALDESGKNVASPTPPTLFADDLVQGYRVDVREAPPQLQARLPVLVPGLKPPPATQLPRQMPGFLRHSAVAPPEAGGVAALPRMPVELQPRFAPGATAPRLQLRRQLQGRLVAGGPWSSLCKRRGSYTIGGVSFQTADEGWVAPAFASKTLDGKPALGLHEAIFRWNDWSLVVAAPPQPPGLNSPDATGQPGLKTPLPAFPPGWALEADFALDGTLLPLRYGHTYQFRLRAVDLAGNSQPASEAGGEFTPASQGFYARYEPVSAPVLLPRHAATAGESPERLVIRSDDKALPTQPSDRHVAPPRADYTVAKAHGTFDTGGKPDPAKAPLIARLSAKFPAILPASEPGLPYLSDPLARSATLIGPVLLFAGAVAKEKPWLSVPFQSDGDVANARPFLLSLAWVPDGQAPRVALQGAQNRLVVALSPGQTARLRVSSAFAPDDLDLLGVWHWLEDALAALPDSPDKKAGAAFLEALCANGLHEMLSPGREITLVHAVQKPLVAPTFAALRPSRGIGDTGCDFNGVLHCDAKTSGKVDVVATWSDPIDDDSTAQPDKDRLKKNARAWEFPLHFLPLEDPTECFNDAPLAKADRTLIAYASDHAPQNGDPNRIAAGEYSPVKRELTFQITPRIRAILRTPRHEFGDTRYHRVEYHAVATSRFREYFLTTRADGTVEEAPSTRGDGAERKAVTLDISASARPEAPKVHSILPTFGWERGAGASKRSGGLRVYLQRPWWSSGDGEMLAVVLPSADDADKDGLREQYISQWGRDPLWTGRTTPTITAIMPPPETQPFFLPGHFPLRRVDVSGNTTRLSLDEAAIQVNIAPHDVHFDPDRNMWFCDIHVSLPQDAYFPFVRLALARYQPHAIPGVELSRVVLADFAQITPTRAASVVKAGGSVGVTVSGPSVGNVAVFIGLEQGNQGDELAWASTGASVAATGAPAGTNTTWSASVPLPPGVPTNQLRIAIREYEIWPTMTDKTAQRLVYAEHLPL